MLITILVVLLILALIGAPWGGYHSFGWGPSGLLGLIAVILLVLLLAGYL